MPYDVCCNFNLIVVYSRRNVDKVVEHSNEGGWACDGLVVVVVVLHFYFILTNTDKI